MTFNKSKTVYKAKRGVRETTKNTKLNGNFHGKNDPDRKIVAEILDIESHGDWNILDSDEDLRLVHYKWNQDRSKINYPNIRGVVVDVSTKTVVCHMYKMESEVCSDNINQNKDGSYSLFGSKKLPENVTFKRGIDGIIYQVFYWKGKGYFCSFKKLNCLRARFPGHRPFYDMYLESGGPNPGELYDSKYEHSPWVFSFLLSHSSMINTSRMTLKEGIVIYLGKRKMYSEDKSPHPKESVQWDCPSLVLAKDITEAGEKKLPFIQETITSKEAEKFLQLGYDQTPAPKGVDQKHRNGEYIIATIPSDSPLPTKVRIVSYSYSYRNKMLNSNPNITSRFFELATDCMNAASSYQDRKKYFHFYPILKALPEEWTEEDDFPKFLVKNRRYLKSFNSYLYNMWLNFTLCVNPRRKKEAAGLLSLYYKAYKRSISWLLTFYKEHDQDEKVFKPEIHSKAVRRALDELRKVSTKTGKVAERDVGNLVYWMSGSEVYNIYRCSHLSLDEDGTVKYLNDI